MLLLALIATRWHTNTHKHTHLNAFTCRPCCFHRLLVTLHPLNKRSSSWAATGRLEHAHTHTLSHIHTHLTTGCIFSKNITQIPADLCKKAQNQSVLIETAERAAASYMLDFESASHLGVFFFPTIGSLIVPFLSAISPKKLPLRLSSWVSISLSSVVCLGSEDHDFIHGSRIPLSSWNARNVQKTGHSAAAQSDIFFDVLEGEWWKQWEQGCVLEAESETEKEKRCEERLAHNKSVNISRRQECEQNKTVPHSAFFCPRVNVRPSFWEIQIWRVGDCLIWHQDKVLHRCKVLPILLSS